MDIGDKVKVKTSYGIKKRHGEQYTLGDIVLISGERYRALKGQDWLIAEKHLEPVEVSNGP